MFDTGMLGGSRCRRGSLGSLISFPPGPSASLGHIRSGDMVLESPERICIAATVVAIAAAARLRSLGRPTFFGHPPEVLKYASVHCILGIYISHLHFLKIIEGRVTCESPPPRTDQFGSDEMEGQMREVECRYRGRQKRKAKPYVLTLATSYPCRVHVPPSFHASSGTMSSVYRSGSDG